MKFQLAISLLVCACGSVFADTTVRGLRIVDAAGTTEYAIGDVRSIKFENSSEMVLTLRSGEATSWNMDDVAGMYCPFIDAIGQAQGGGEQSKIEKIEENAVSLIGGVLSLTGLDNTQVCIADVCGKIVFSAQVGDSWAYDMRSLPKGVYILRVNTKVYKIANL